ncbi:MAG TPA: TetR/AcrR family transcriptional regulator [Phytomonospora sp.]
MPRPKGDHEARRRELSEAVWRVLAAHGFGGLTMRAVAAELNATTGLLTHYFPTKRDLLAYALELLDTRTQARPRREPGEGIAAIRAALLDILPLTPKDAAANKTWISSWDAALGDDGLSADHAERYARSRKRMRVLVEAAQARGEIRAGDPGRVSEGAHSFVLGLVVQAVFDPAAFPAERQVELLDDYLAGLGGTPGEPGAPPSAT